MDWVQKLGWAMMGTALAGTGLALVVKAARQFARRAGAERTWVDLACGLAYIILGVGNAVNNLFDVRQAKGPLSWAVVVAGIVAIALIFLRKA
jgi:hypothetical protein